MTDDDAIQGTYLAKGEYRRGVDLAQKAITETMQSFCESEARRLGLSPNYSMMSMMVLAHAFAEAIAVGLVLVEKNRPADDLKELFQLMLGTMQEAADPLIDLAVKERERMKQRSRRRRPEQ